MKKVSKSPKRGVKDLQELVDRAKAEREPMETEAKLKREAKLRAKEAKQASFPHSLASWCKPK